MKTIKIKTIDVNCKEWFDKVNGNSYFAGTVTINYGMNTQKSYVMPFQYGYGSQYEHEAGIVLKNNKVIKLDDYTALWQYCNKNKIILRCNIQRGCKKRELMYYSK